MKTRYQLIILLVLIAGFIGACRTTSKIAKTPKAKNIILLIGDGMGVAQMYAGHIAKNAELNMESCKHIGFSRTHSASDLITDSGAGGTAIACGIKTTNKFIGMNPDSVAVKSILHYAEENNKSTGLVATAAITHATPASFIAHNISRYNYEALAEDFLKTDIEVFIGGGLDHFTKRKDQKSLLTDLKAKGYQIVTDQKGLKASKKSKLAALVYDKHPPYMADGRGNFLPLATNKAIELLNKDKNGFFLMIEGSQIDWAGHDNDSEKLIKEVLDFDEAVGLALDFAKKDGETLVIITADHETGGYVLSNEEEKRNSLKGIFASEHHSAVAVPVMAFGPGAEKFTGFMENTDLFHKMYEAFGFDKSKLSR